MFMGGDFSTEHDGKTHADEEDDDYFFPSVQLFDAPAQG
jgi:hypothetical protein